MKIIKEKINKLKIRTIENKIIRKNKKLNYYETGKFSALFYENYVDRKIRKLNCELKLLENKIEKSDENTKE